MLPLHAVPNHWHGDTVAFLKNLRIEQTMSHGLLQSFVSTCSLVHGSVPKPQFWTLHPKSALASLAKPEIFLPYAIVAHLH